MSSASKAKGTLFEREIVDVFATSFDVQRLPRAGAKDEGDVEVRLIDGVRLIVEAKNHKALALSDWLRQAEVEADNREAKIGDIACVPVVFAKRRGKNALHSYVVMDAEEFITLLRLLGAGL